MRLTVLLLYLSLSEYHNLRSKTIRCKQKCDITENIVVINSVRKNKWQYLHSDDLLNEGKIDSVFKHLKVYKKTLKEMNQRGFGADKHIVEYGAKHSLKMKPKRCEYKC